MPNLTPEQKRAAALRIREAAAKAARLINAYEHAEDLLAAADALEREAREDERWQPRSQR